MRPTNRQSRNQAAPEVISQVQCFTHNPQEPLRSKACRCLIASERIHETMTDDSTIITCALFLHMCSTIGNCSHTLKRSTRTLATYQHHLSHKLHGHTNSTSPDQPSVPRSLCPENFACTGRNNLRRILRSMQEFFTTHASVPWRMAAPRGISRDTQTTEKPPLTRLTPFTSRKRAQLMALPQASNGGPARQRPGHSWAATCIGTTASQKPHAAVAWPPHSHASGSGSLQHLLAVIHSRILHILLLT